MNSIRMANHLGSRCSVLKGSSPAVSTVSTTSRSSQPRKAEQRPIAMLNGLLWFMRQLNLLSTTVQTCPASKDRNHPSHAHFSQILATILLATPAHAAPPADEYFRVDTVSDGFIDAMEIAVTPKG